MVQSLWLQKFVLVGGTIAFLAANLAALPRQVAPKAATGAPLFDPVLAVALVPVLSIILDMRVVEYALHARLCSRFLIREFPDAARSVRWEREAWGEAGSPDRLILSVRNLLSLGATALPTLLLRSPPR